MRGSTRVSRAQVRHVIDHAGLFFVQPATHPTGQTTRCCSWVTTKPASPVEVVGVELADGRLRVIQAVPMRSGYQDLYEEAKKWRQ